MSPYGPAPVDLAESRSHGIVPATGCGDRHVGDDEAAVLGHPRRAEEVAHAELAVLVVEVRARGDEGPGGAVAGVDLDADRVVGLELLVAGGHLDRGRDGRLLALGVGRRGEDGEGRERGEGESSGEVHGGRAWRVPPPL